MTMRVIPIITKGFRILAVPALIVSLFALCACSKVEKGQMGEKETKSATQQTTEAIRDYGKRPIDKARAAQRLGEDHTRAIDEAVGGQGR